MRRRAMVIEARKPPVTVTPSASDWAPIMTGVPAVVAPDPTMSDQRARARRLASLGLVALVEGDPLHPDDVAAAIARAIALPRPRARVDLDGAASTCALLERLVAEGEGAWRSTDSSASRSTRV